MEEISLPYLDNELVPQQGGSSLNAVPPAERFIGIIKCYYLIQVGRSLAFLMLLAINWVMRTSIAEHFGHRWIPSTLLTALPFFTTPSHQ